MSVTTMIKVLIDRQVVEQRITEMAGEVAADYGEGALVCIGVLNGAVPFMMELIGCLPEPLYERLVYDFVDVSSYDGTESRGEARVDKDCVVDVKGQDVLVVDGIVDTGLTLERVLAMLAQRQPRSLKVCALLDKPARRKWQVPVDYCGFTIEDVFVVGYGMDYDQRLRALPYIGVLEAQ